MGSASGPHLPHVISWNLTRRCNLACGHCYLDAQQRAAPSAAECDTAQCLALARQIAAVNPQCVLILTGGEPLLRPDVFEIARGAADLGLFVVLGTNGLLLEREVVRRAQQAGVRGFGVSLDAPAAAAHDALRGQPGAFARALRGLEALRAEGAPFLIQYTMLRAGELGAMAELACGLGAAGLNVYHLVCTGRGQAMLPLSSQEHERSLEELYALQQQYRGRMMINAKCAPHFRRVVHRADPASPQLQTAAGGCPAGTSYARVTPEGELTACPYLPTVEADLRVVPFAEAWQRPNAFAALREPRYPGRCGVCEYQALCGGCRARAFASSGQLLGDDPLCAHAPAAGAVAVSLPAAAAVEPAPGGALPWSDDARARMTRVPSFARDMVTRRVEAYCKERGIPQVTPEVLAELRARMGAAPPFLRPGGER